MKHRHPTLAPVARLACAATLLAGSAAALAHPGADAGSHHGLTWLDILAAGFTHPLAGPDHLAAMLAVGLWSALAARGRGMWLAPLAFMGMLLLGALAGMAGLALPGVEPTIAASLLVLGLLVAARRQLPAAAGALLVGGFALFHGLAHGSELAAGGHAAAMLAGMLAATGALHVAGLSLGLAMRRRTAWWPRASGAAVALLGGSLLAQML